MELPMRLMSQQTTASSLFRYASLIKELSAGCRKGAIAALRGDFATSSRKWTPLAKQGNADAQYNLGLIYRNGWGVSQDYKTTVKWYRLAAERGMPMPTTIWA